MGTDLFTSSRGPGVIGTLMALLVLGGFGLLSLFVFDEDLQGGGKSIESIIADDAKQLDGLEKRVKSETSALEVTKSFKDTASAIISEKVKLAGATDRRTELETSVAEETKQVEVIRKEFDEYAQSYRESARTSMVGRKMDELKTLDGASYTKVKVTEIDAARMQIRHSGGITGVALDQLPAELQDYLQVDASEKDQRLADEKKMRETRNRSADFGEAEYAIAMLEHELKGLDHKRAEARRALAEAEASIPSLQVAIDRKAVELVENEQKARTGGISNAPQVRSQIQQLESRKSAAEQRLPALRSAISALDAQYRSMEQDIRTRQTDLKNKKAEAAKKKASEAANADS